MNSVGLAAFLSVVLSAGTVFAIETLDLLDRPQTNNDSASALVDDSDDLSREVQQLRAELRDMHAGPHHKEPAPGRIHDMEAEIADLNAYANRLEDEIEALKNAPKPAAVEGGAVDPAAVDAMVEAAFKKQLEKAADLNEAVVEETMEAIQERDREERRAQFQQRMDERRVEFVENAEENARNYLESQAEELNLTPTQIDDVSKAMATRVQSISTYLESVRQDRENGLEISNDSIKAQLEALREPSNSSIKLALTDEQFAGIERGLNRTDAAALYLNGINPSDVGIESGRRRGGFGGRGNG